MRRVRETATDRPTTWPWCSRRCPTRPGWPSSNGCASPVRFPPQDRPAEEVGVCLKHLQARAGVSQSTASQYLAILQRADLVTSTRIGQWTHYKRNEETLARLAEHIAADL